MAAAVQKGECESGLIFSFPFNVQIKCFEAKMSPSFLPVLDSHIMRKSDLQYKINLINPTCTKGYKSLYLVPVPPLILFTFCPYCTFGCS